MCVRVRVRVCYLLSVELKNVTQGLRMLLSEEGARYMASEKQVSSSFRSSVLNTEIRPLALQTEGWRQN